MPTAWDILQQQVVDQQNAEAQKRKDLALRDSLISRGFEQRYGFAPKGRGYATDESDPRMVGIHYMVNQALQQSGEAPTLYPQQKPTMAQQYRAQPRSAGPPTQVNLSPMVQALRQYRNPWDRTNAGVTATTAQKGTNDELNQWMQATDIGASPMERYLKWRDVYKPINQGWQDKFQAERERAAAIKAGLLGNWGQLQGQRAGANAQVQSAAQASQAQKYQADLAHKTAMEQAKMQYALGLQQAGGVGK